MPPSSLQDTAENRTARTERNADIVFSDFIVSVFLLAPVTGAFTLFKLFSVEELVTLNLDSLTIVACDFVVGAERGRVGTVSRVRIVEIVNGPVAVEFGVVEAWSPTRMDPVHVNGMSGSLDTCPWIPAMASGLKALVVEVVDAFTPELDALLEHKFLIDILLSGGGTGV